MTYRSMKAGVITFQGHNNDEIQAYLAQPEGDDSIGSVVLLHHMPGWDESSIEMTRKLAHYGYNAICPDLFYRFGEGEPDEVAAVARSQGGKADDETVGDADGAATYLRGLANSNGKVGIIGFCSGGRQVVLVASHLGTIDAAVDCWGGGVIAGGKWTISESRPVAPIDLTDNLNTPLLGIFGNDDPSPTPEEVNQHEQALKDAGKTYEFHRYDGAGHGFFDFDKPAYRPEQAQAAWREIFKWYGTYLSS